MLKTNQVKANPDLHIDTDVHFEQAKSLVNKDNLVRILSNLVDVASPTGEEGRLARIIASILNQYQLNGEEQVIDKKQSNALGIIKGNNTANGSNLMLYAPIDTVTSSNVEEDIPWAEVEMKPEMWARSYSNGQFVFGLGAHNPKGHAACIIEAARVLKKANINLNGDLILGFGAGGMPTNARKGTRKDSGHGAGCNHMLYKMEKPDGAIIAKSGWAISYEEVGLIWFEVEVKGIHNYSGARHLMPYKNPILDATRLMQKLDEWLKEWPNRHRSGLVAPQGVISFIESGWERMPSFTPAVCRFRIDLRLSPRTSANEAEKEFAGVLESYSEALGIQTSYKKLVAIPGTTTNAEEPVIKQAVDSWETLTHKEHQFVKGLSGATDANILRMHGIPTARIGLPKANIPNIDFQLGMNAVDIEDLYQLTLLLIHIAIKFCNTKK